MDDWGMLIEPLPEAWAAESGRAAQAPTATNKASFFTTVIGVSRSELLDGPGFDDRQLGKLRSAALQSDS
jgi:hypothetical protein